MDQIIKDFIIVGKNMVKVNLHGPICSIMKEIG